MGNTSVNGPGYSVDVNTDWKEMLVIGVCVSEFWLQNFVLLLMSNSLFQVIVALIIVCCLIFCVCRGGCHGRKTSNETIEDGSKSKDATFGLVFLNVIINLSLFTSIEFLHFKHNFLTSLSMLVNIDNMKLFCRNESYSFFQIISQ